MTFDCRSDVRRSAFLNIKISLSYPAFGPSIFLIQTYFHFPNYVNCMLCKEKEA